ncbi:unnamed protein product [Brassica rapa]|uniref:DNA 5'-3' helicase n=2 Tax=Brassica TaxID=3705 RepID=A0A816Y491_BRANA|nr:unnamed protein product [Brassica napus]CAG7888908.1 unnamed protein product [Brassica rapa]
MELLLGQSERQVEYDRAGRIIKGQKLTILCLLEASYSVLGGTYICWFVLLLSSQAGIEQKTLKFCYECHCSLMLTHDITKSDEFLPIQRVCGFATLVGTRGFSVITKPYGERTPHVPDPILQVSMLCSCFRYVATQMLIQIYCVS